MVAKKQLRVRIGFLHVFQSIVVLLQEHAVRVGLHPGRQSHGVQPLRVALVLLQAHGSQRTCFCGRVFKRFNPIWVRSAGDATEKTLVVQKVIAGQHALQVELFE